MVSWGFDDLIIESNKTGKNDSIFHLHLHRVEFGFECDNTSEKSHSLNYA